MESQGDYEVMEAKRSLSLIKKMLLPQITDWLLIPTWSKLRIVELVGLVLLLASNLLLYLGAKNR
jgi:hypothetical protein